MSRPIVHLGFHKTATTWLQQRIFPGATSHEFLSRKTAQDAFLKPPGMHFCPDLARRQLGLDNRNRPVLLSEENFSGYLHNGGLHGFLAPEVGRRIKAVMPDAHIVIFIRNQFDICRASYAQYVSGGGTWGARRYFETASHVQGALTRAWKAPAFEFEHFEFDRLISHYDALFGTEQVHVYPYEWMRDPSALISRLQRDLGMELTVAPEQAGKVNSSLSAPGLATMRAANLFTRQSVVNKDRIVHVPGSQVMRHGLKWLLHRTPGMCGAGGLPQRYRQHVASHYPASNRRLMELRKLQLDQLGYPL